MQNAITPSPYRPLQDLDRDGRQVIVHPMNVEACLSYMIIEANAADGPIFKGIDKYAPIPESDAFRCLKTDRPVPEEHHALILRRPGADGNHTYSISNPKFAVGPHIDRTADIWWAPMPLAPDHEAFEAAKDS